MDYKRYLESLFDSGMIETWEPPRPQLKPKGTGDIFKELRYNNNMETKTIDVTPTWKAMLPALVVLLEHKVCRKDAIKELERMAEGADRFNEMMKEGPKLVERMAEAADIYSQTVKDAIKI